MLMVGWRCRVRVGKEECCTFAEVAPFALEGDMGFNETKNCMIGISMTFVSTV